MAAYGFLVLVLLVTGPTGDDRVIDVGREDWEKPWGPDLEKAGGRIPIPVEKRIDVVILGDGYYRSERKSFEEDVREWREKFLRLTPWRQFRGCFRIRALWTPSVARSTTARRSRYRLACGPRGIGQVETSDTAAAVFASLDRLGVNPAATREGAYTHVAVVLLARDQKVRNPSGLTRALVSPNKKRRVRVGFGSYTHHEFGHSYGGLRDEYIREKDLESDRKPPEVVSLFNRSNVAHSTDRSRLPWSHLMPGTDVNPDPGSVIGVLWNGGVAEKGSWHSEGRCLMNGRHENWNLEKTRRGELLRDYGRFCFWCEEILVALTMWRTGRLGDSNDGEALWKQWVEKVRPAYQRAFDVAYRIRKRNGEDAKSGLREAKIFIRP